MTKLFSEIAEEYEKFYFKSFPDQALLYGRKDARLDCFTDYSVDGVKKWQREEDRFLELLQKVDISTLNEREQVTFNLLKDNLESARASRICQTHLWNVNPLFGWHTYITQIAEVQPVGSTVYREQALARWSSFGNMVDGQIASLIEGLKSGFTAPKPAVIRVAGQFADLITDDVNNSPFFSLVQRSEDETFKKEMTEVIQTIINPALNKYKQFLETNYLPATREEIGVSALPCGKAGYQAKIKESTTLNISAAEIYQLGEQYMQVLAKQVGIIGEKLYQTKDMAETFKRALNDKTNLFANEEELLAYNFAALKRAKDKAPQWFDVMPKAEGTIRPYPLYRAKAGAAGEYIPPNEDGNEPGFFYINTYEADKKNRVDHESTLFHELIPGHHFQIALHQEDKNLPSLNKYLLNSGYCEGWALYVERLADSMGLFSDDIARLGMLSNEALRTARLVVDTGIHVFGWARDQAIDYMKTHTAVSDDVIEAEVDRYIMMPGQATSYMLGKFEIEKWRDIAKIELGDRFDIRQFHNQVLINGGVTLPMLATHLRNWINLQRKTFEDKAIISSSPKDSIRFFQEPMLEEKTSLQMTSLRPTF